MNAFELLGTEVKLVLSEEEIREAFREKAAIAHPDSGGDEKNFSKIQEAQSVLLSPALRLKEWLRVKESVTDSRGQIENELMDLFQTVAFVGAEAEKIVREAQTANSALAKAMLQVRQMNQREKVSDVLKTIFVEIERRVSLFLKIESGDVPKDEAGKIFRDLVFLQKWQLKLKELYGQLI